MKLVLGCIRRADKDFHMIQPGDHVAVGVSGGKDSMVLLYALALYRRFCPNEFSLTAVTLKPSPEFDETPIAKLCEEIDVPYVCRDSDILDVVFNHRKEKNPCSLCAKMRRGALTDLCRELGINKLALGHHRDDAIETLFLSMLQEGRLHTFHPVTYLSRSGITQIRPMVYLSEQHIVQIAQEKQLPIVKSPCPANGHTKREDIKRLLDHISQEYPNARELLLGALQNQDQYGLWNRD